MMVLVVMTVVMIKYDDGSDEGGGGEITKITMMVAVVMRNMAMLAMAVMPFMLLSPDCRVKLLHCHSPDSILTRPVPVLNAVLKPTPVNFPH